MDIAERPCPQCGNEEGIVYPQDSLWGAFTEAALQCALVIGYRIESLGLPLCTRCGKPAWEGGTMCPICVDILADEYFAFRT